MICAKLVDSSTSKVSAIHSDTWVVRYEQGVKWPMATRRVGHKAPR